MKTSKLKRVIKILSGMVWLAFSTASAICFGMVSGLRGCGSQTMHYPYNWYAVVFIFILCSGVLAAAYLIYGDRIKRELCAKDKDGL